MFTRRSRSRTRFLLLLQQPLVCNYAIILTSEENHAEVELGHIVVAFFFVRVLGKRLEACTPHILGRRLIYILSEV